LIGSLNNHITKWIVEGIDLFPSSVGFDTLFLSANSTKLHWLLSVAVC
jgi:hypothetical protein